MKRINARPIKQKLLLLIAFVTMALLGFVSGCATTTTPADFMALTFDNGVMDSVAVLPVLDHRIDQSKQLSIDDWVLPKVELLLKKKGYLYTVHRDRSLLVSNISRDALEAPTKEFIASLPPASSKWILVLVLEDSSSKLTFGSTGNAEMSGYLFDKANEELIWRDKELSRIGQGGLAGMVMKGKMERWAVEQAVIQILQTLPPRNN